MNFQTAMIQLPLMVREQPGATTLNNGATVAKEMHDICDLAQEAFFVLTLTNANKIINKHLVTLGILNATVIHPREVFRAAILDGAATIVLVHNHPGGDPRPSPEDINTTKQLVEAGKIVGIHVLDHIIVGHSPDQYTSMKDSGIIK